MENTTLALLIVAIIVLVLLFRFRESVKLTLKGFGLNFAAEGKNNSSKLGTKEPPPIPQSDRGNTALAPGERAVAIGGSSTAPITTGDQNKK